jgi:hypothetical protein
MSKPRIRFSLVTHEDTTHWDVGKRVLQAFCSKDPRLTPEYLDNSEAIKMPFQSLADCEKYWAPEVIIDAGNCGRILTRWPCMWKRTKSVRYRGEMNPTKVNNRGQRIPGWLKVDADSDRTTDWSELFISLVDAVKPIFATLHLFTDVETRRGAFGAGEVAAVGADDFLAGPPGVVLEDRGIPNLAWATFFGGEYSADVDAQALHASNFGVEAFGNGFLVKVTPCMFDVVDDFALFSARRSELKKLFRSGLFRLQEEPRIEDGN